MIIKQKQPGNAKDNPTKLATLTSQLQQEITAMDEIFNNVESTFTQLTERMDTVMKLKKSTDNEQNNLVKQIKQLQSLQDENKDIYLHYQKNYQEFVTAFERFKQYYNHHYLATIHRSST